MIPSGSCHFCYNHVLGQSEQGVLIVCYNHRLNEVFEKKLLIFTNMLNKINNGTQNIQQNISAQQLHRNEEHLYYHRL